MSLYFFYNYLIYYRKCIPQNKHELKRTFTHVSDQLKAQIYHQFCLRDRNVKPSVDYTIKCLNYKNGRGNTYFTTYCDGGTCVSTRRICLYFCWTFILRLYKVNLIRTVSTLLYNNIQRCKEVLQNNISYLSFDLT